MNYKQLFIGVIIAFAALGYTLWNVSLADLFASFKTVKYGYIVPAIAFIVLSYLGRAWRWRELLRPIKDVGSRELYAPLMVGFMGNILPARAGEFLRAYLLSKKHHLTFSSAFASIVVERLFDLLMLFALFAWVFYYHAEVFETDTNVKGIAIADLATVFGRLSVGMVGFLILFIYLMVSHREWVIRWVLRLIAPLPKKWHDKVEYLIEEFSLGLEVARQPAVLLRVALYSVVVWVAIVLSYYPFYWAFDLNDKSAGSLLVLVVAVCVLITAVPTPAFLGSFNAGVLIALHEVMHEAEITAVSFGMVAWVVNFLVLFVLGMYFIVHEHYSVRALIEAEERGVPERGGKV